MSAQPARKRCPLTEAQRALGDRVGLVTLHAPRAAEDFFLNARWWELEAMRGYGSRRQSQLYARNMISAGWARIADGSERPWTPKVDQPVEACPACEGPIAGLWGCGGARVTQTKHGTGPLVCRGGR